MPLLKPGGHDLISATASLIRLPPSSSVNAGGKTLVKHSSTGISDPAPFPQNAPSTVNSDPPPAIALTYKPKSYNHKFP